MEAIQEVSSPFAVGVNSCVAHVMWCVTKGEVGRLSGKLMLEFLKLQSSRELQYWCTHEPEQRRYETSHVTGHITNVSNDVRADPSAW